MIWKWFLKYDAFGKYLHFQSTNQLFGLKISKIGNVEKNPSLHYYTLLYCNLGEYMIKENIWKEKKIVWKKIFVWDFEKIWKLIRKNSATAKSLLRWCQHCNVVTTWSSSKHNKNQFDLKKGSQISQCGKGTRDEDQLAARWWWEDSAVNNSHGLSPPGGLVSPSGGFVSLLCD